MNLSDVPVSKAQAVEIAKVLKAVFQLKYAFNHDRAHEEQAMFDLIASIGEAERVLRSGFSEVSILEWLDVAWSQDLGKERI